MKFRYAVEIEIKNDALTREAGEHDLAMMIQNRLEDNLLDELPWVIEAHYALVKE